MTARRRDRSSPPAYRGVVVATVVCFAGALLTASTLYPTYRAPDEPAHVDQVRAVRSLATWPGLRQRRLSSQVVGSYPLVGYLSGVPGEAPPLQAEAAPPRDDRPTFERIAPDAPTTLGNQMGQHPPLYYLLAAGWLALLDGVGPVAFDLEVWWLRLVGVLLVAPLPWLAARTAAALALRPAGVAAAAVAVLAVPMLVHIGSSVNNDVLLVSLAGVATLQAASVAGGDLSVRRAAWSGVVVGAALLTKIFALALLPLAVGAAAVAWSRDRTAARAAGTSSVTTLLVATALGGWWWIRNLVVHGTLQPSGAPSPAPPDGFVADASWWATFALARLVRRWWLEPDTVARTTPALIVLATLVALALLAVAFLRRGGVDRRDLALLLVPAGGCLAIVVVGAWRAYARTGIPFALHGRYLYPGVVGLAVVAAAGATGLLRRRAPAVLLAGAVVLQLTAAWWTLTFYWGVPEVTAPLASLRAWVAWSPLPPAVTLLPTVVAAMAAVAAALLSLRRAPPARGRGRRRDRRPGPPRRSEPARRPGG